MASTIQVVLQEDVEKLGKAGDLVKVKQGYARNYLIPRSLAVAATRGNIDRIEHEQAAVLARIAKLKQNAEEVAKQLAKLTITIAKQVGEAEKLYGSVTAKEVADELSKKGFDIDRKKLELPGVIKQLGEFEVTARLGNEVTCNFKLVVEQQQD